MDTDKALDLGKLLSILGAIGICYDIGYFAEPGLNFFNFLSFKDHLTSLIFFAPPCLIMALPWFALRMVNEQRQNITDVFGCGWIAIILSWQAGRQEIAHVIPIFGPIDFYFLGISYFVLSGYLIAVLISFPSGTIVFFAVIGLTYLILMFANFQYHLSLRANQFEVEITLKADDKTQSRPQPAHLVRVIDDGIFLIFKDAPDRLVFVRKDALTTLSKQVQP